MSQVNKDDLNILEGEITEQDIKTGSARNCFYCPAAKAIRRLLHDKSATVSVGYGSVAIFLAQTKQTFVYRLPINLTEFIEMFDNNEKYRYVKPLQFKLVLDKVYQN